jgi:hypothetical protein
MVALIATIVLAMPAEAPKIEDLAWMKGSWLGKVGADDVEETWTAQKNGSMMGMFRWFRNGKLRLMEMMTIAEADGKVTMKLKHFNSLLHSFEQQNETTDFTLLSVEPNKAVWDEVKPEGGPQQLLYTRDGKRLTIRFVRPGGGKPTVLDPFEFVLQ